MSKEKLVMKYEKPEVEVIMTDEEDVIRTSPFQVEEDDDEEGYWSGFFWSIFKLKSSFLK